MQSSATKDDQGSTFRKTRSVRAELIIGFVILGLAMLALSLVLIRSVSSVATSHDMHMPALHLVHLIEQEFNAAVSESLAYVLAGDAEDLSEHRESVEQINAYLGRFQHIAQLDNPAEAAERKMFGDIVAALDHWLEHGAELMEMQEQDAEPSVEKILAYELHVEEVRDALIVLREVEQEEVTAAETLAQSAIQRSELALLWMGISALLLAVGMGYLLAARISRPLNALSAAARDVQEGKFDVQFDEGVNSEFGAVFASFHAMVAARRAAEEGLARARDELDDRVVKRTAALQLANERLQQEVDERRRTESALIVSEQRFRQLAESIREVFWIQDISDGQIVYISPAYEAVWGRSCLSLYADPGTWMEAVHPRDRDRVAEGDRTHRSGEGTVMEYRILLPDGTTRWIRDQSFPVHENDGTVRRVTGIAQDITVQKINDEERENLIRSLAAKNEELERFTYTVSHDLKSPLVTIRGFLGALQSDLQEGRTERVHEDCMQIGNAADQMSRLLEELLELSRLGHNMQERRTVDMQQLAAQQVLLLNRRVQACSGRIVLAENLPSVSGDSRALQEVFQNLLDNALKFSAVRDEPLIEIGVRNDGEVPVLFVRDNGVGIEPRFHDKVMGLFERLNPEISGTGIGLALVKRIIEAHGGQVWIESEGLDAGCTVCFTVPDPGESSGLHARPA